MITLRLTKNNVFVENVTDDIRKQLYNLLSYNVEGAFFSPAYRNGHWDGKTRLYNSRYKSFKIGLLARVMEWLKVEEIEYEINDERKIEFDYDFSKMENLPITLRDVQIEAIEAYCNPRNGVNLGRGLLALPPRSGKTIIMATLGKVINHYPVLLITHRIDLCIQAKKVFEPIFGEKIGIVGDGNLDVDANIVISTIQSICQAFQIKEKFDDKEKPLKDYTPFIEFLNSAKVIFIDEAHCSTSNVFQSLPNILIKAEHVIGVSGTPYTTNGEDMLIEQLCGAILYTLERAEAMQKGYVLPIITYFINLPPMEVTKYDWIGQKAQALNSNPYLFDGVVKLVRELESKNMSSIIICKEKAQAGKIQKLLKCEYLHGGISGMDREKIYEKLNNKEILTIVSTVSDIGINIPTLDTVIIAGVGKSKVMALQRVRCGTKWGDKEHGYIFVFHPRIMLTKHQIDADYKDYLNLQANKLKRIYKAEKFEIREIEYEKLK